MELTEKQKNCPYCHDRANLLQSNDERPIDGDIVYINKDGYLNSKTDCCHVYRKANYCPMCGRPLGGNEEGEPEPTFHEYKHVDGILKYVKTTYKELPF